MPKEFDLFIKHLAQLECFYPNDELSAQITNDDELSESDLESISAAGYYNYNQIQLLLKKIEDQGK